MSDGGGDRGRGTEGRRGAYGDDADRARERAQERVPKRRRLRRRDNTGSTARDHLANERTYLAWLRTGFGTAVLGVGVARLIGGPDELTAVAAGVLLIVLGIVMLIYGTLRYFRIVRALDEGLMEVGRAGPITFGVAAAVVVTIVAVLLIA